MTTASPVTAPGPAHAYPQSFETVQGCLASAVYAYRAGKLDQYALHLSEATAAFQRLATHDPDRCLGCGKITFLNPDGCCTVKCATTLSLRARTL